jgi:hypothetical protein
MIMWFDILKTEISLYMVKDEVWEEAGGTTESAHIEEYWTIEELEEKLGRKLTVDDFSSVPLNWSVSILGRMQYRVPHEAEILLDRIGGQAGRIKLAREYLKGSTYEPYLTEARMLAQYRV